MPVETTSREIFDIFFRIILFTRRIAKEPILRRRIVERLKNYLNYFLKNFSFKLIPVESFSIGFLITIFAILPPRMNTLASIV